VAGRVKQVLAIRHGEYYEHHEPNAEAPLTPNGINTARRVAKIVVQGCGRRVRVVRSRYVRTRQMSDALQGAYGEVRVLPWLEEMLRNIEPLLDYSEWDEIDTLVCMGHKPWIQSLLFWADAEDSLTVDFGDILVFELDFEGRTIAYVRKLS
jgi:phosphohistidine phosphatase SixA